MPELVHPSGGAKFQSSKFCAALIPRFQWVASPHEFSKLAGNDSPFPLSRSRPAAHDPTCAFATPHATRSAPGRATQHLARRVEAVHRERADCPRGLADFLQGMQQAIESHMQKEEQILFPAMLAGGRPVIGMPVGVMLSEPDDHGRALAVLAELTKDPTPPADGCGTWQALYAGTRKLTDDVMAHLSLESNVLFPRFGA